MLIGIGWEDEFRAVAIAGVGNNGVKPAGEISDPLAIRYGHGPRGRAGTRRGGEGVVTGRDDARVRGAALDFFVDGVQLRWQGGVEGVCFRAKTRLTRGRARVLANIHEAAREGTELNVIPANGKRDQLRVRAQAIRLRGNQLSASTIPFRQDVVGFRAAT